MVHEGVDEEAYERFLGDHPPLYDPLPFRVGEPQEVREHRPRHPREASETFLEAELDLAKVALTHSFEDVAW